MIKKRKKVKNALEKIKKLSLKLSKERRKAKKEINSGRTIKNKNKIV